jgi:RNA polymerase sigma factor (TIGR02999 family)
MLAQVPDDRDDNGRLTEAIYKELRQRARFFLRGERPGHSLQSTEIVHEAWLRLSALDKNLASDKNHFLAIAGCVMRNLLVDHARKRKAVRRGGDLARTRLDGEFLFSLDDHLQVLEVDKALTRLAAIDPRAAKIVELRFFAGLTEPEIARAVNASERSVKRDWAFAKAWMRTVLDEKLDPS